MRRFLALITLVLSVSACASDQPLQPARPRPVDLTDYSYLAVDGLLDQAAKNQYFTGKQPGAPLLVSSVVDVTTIDRTTPFGRMLSEQIGSRLRQRGYPVTEVRLRDNMAVVNDSGEHLLTRRIERLTPSQAAIGLVTGTYAVGGERVYVNLRMVDPDTQSVVASSDIVMPLTRDNKGLLGLSLHR